MQRRPEELVNAVFDIAVVGGGIYGACMAWEAVTRGLSVALIEKADFGWATSANMHRILHGGFRYLRNADLVRIRESVRERNTMMRLASHLSGPLPFLVPTSGRGIQNKEVMRAAILIYDLLAADRNGGIRERGRRIPQGRIVSRDECLRLAPGLDAVGVTGGAVWYDGALSDPSRLTLEFVRAAVSGGAKAANYVEAVDFLRDGERVTGVLARDALSGDRFDIRARLVVDCSGPWANGLRRRALGGDTKAAIRYVRSVDVVTKPLTVADHGLALMGPQHHAPQNIIRYFVAPWKGLSVLGSVDYMSDTDPDEFGVSDGELEHMLHVLVRAMPGAPLTLDDFHAVQAGLIPHDDTEPLDDPYNAARHYKIIDFGKTYGVEGLISVTGIKYTTARDIAEKTIDRVLPMLGAAWSPSRTAQLPLPCTVGDDLEHFRAAALGRRSSDEAAIVEALIARYGALHDNVLRCGANTSDAPRPLDEQRRVYDVQVDYGVKEEMAVKLTDIVFRRASLADYRHPGIDVLRRVAARMAALLQWSDARSSAEIAEVEAQLTRFRVRSDGASTQSSVS
jgi:glycerol-3-phosphate dehydrogenase